MLAPVPGNPLPQANDSMPPTVPLQASAARDDDLHRLLATAYRMRTLCAALWVVMVAAVLHRLHASAALWVLVVLNGIAWPQLTLLLSRRSASPVRQEKRHLMVDALMCGAWIAWMQFNLLASVVLGTSTAMGLILFGGRRLIVRGVALAVLGCALAAAVNGFAFMPDGDLLETAAALPLMVGYPLGLSTTAYVLGRRVRVQNQHLAELSSTDRLSGLLNRGSWEEVLTHTLANARAGGSPASLLLIDLDNFKHVNDGYGHLVGDEVIAQVGRIIAASLRAGDRAGRYGGDEFSVVLDGGDATAATRVAERIRTGIANARFACAPELRCHASIGIAAATGDVVDARAWIRRADQALYGSKSNGRDRCTTAAARS